MHCEWCGDAHDIDHYPSHPDAVDDYGNFNQNKNNPLSNAYNPDWRNRPNFQSGSNQSAWPMPQEALGFLAHAQIRLQQPI